jgi:hypothetical protein
MAIEEFTNQMKALRESSSADADLSISPAAKSAYLEAITAFRSVLSTEKGKLASLAGLLEPGNLHSAQQTKKELVADVNGPDGIIQKLEEYIAYLDEFEQTVTDVADRFMAEG